VRLALPELLHAFDGYPELRARLVTRGGGASILFRVYEPLQTTANAQQHQPISVRESSCAALPMALLAR